MNIVEQQTSALKQAPGGGTHSTMQASADRAALLTRADALVPTLSARSAQAESLRRVPDETIADFISAGVTRIVQPARFGGYAMDWDALCEMAMILARGCMSQSWVATVLAEHAWLAGLFPLQAQQDIWGTNTDALISTGLVPTGSVKRVTDGFVLNGKWPFSSGVHHAQWTIIGELLRDSDQPPSLYYFLLPKENLTVIDDWHTMGMVGTGSCSVELNNVFVPSHRSLSGSLIAEGNTPGAALSDAPIFKMPLSGFAPTVLAAVIVGATDAIVGAFTESISGKAQGSGSTSAFDLTLSRIAASAVEANAARLLILDSTTGNMAKLRAGAKLNERDAQMTARNGAYATWLCNQAARRVFEAAGARSLYNASGLQRIFRDISSAATHAALNWDRISVAYGRSALGATAQ